MKKILFVDGTLNTGGAERIFCTLVRSLDPAKYEIQVIVTGKPGGMIHLVPKEVKCTVLNIVRSRYAVFALAKILRREKPDAVFTVSFASVTACFLARFVSGVRFRLSMRYCLMPKEMIQQGFIKVGSVVFRWEKFVLSRLEAIIAEHTYMADELKEIYGLNGRNIFPVLNPLDEKLMNQSVADDVAFSFPKGQVNVVAAGRLNKEKGFDFLLESFAQVVKHDAIFHLYLIGQNVGEYQSMLNEIVIRLGIENNVHFEGFQENPFIYFKKSDLFVLSSRWEASPNVVFENLYLGSRIVATECSPILPDIIEDSGRLVPWGDKEMMAKAILNYQAYRSSSRKYYSLADFEVAIVGAV